MIPIFQNHAFEKSIQKKLDRKQTRLNIEQVPQNRHIIIDRVMKNSPEIAKSPKTDNFLTPNRTNYNFKEASPFLVNINQRPRRKKLYADDTGATEEKSNAKNTNNATSCNKNGQQTATEPIEIIEISDSDENCDEQNDTAMVKNLFELTEENIEKHLAAVVKKTRKDSLIDAWRGKVNESRLRKSIFPIHEDEIEAFLSEHSAESEPQSIETIIAAKQTPTQPNPSETEDESFITAPDVNGDTFVIERDLPAKHDETIGHGNKTPIILQTQEVYEHFDPDDNIIFYENKLLANPVKPVPKSNSKSDGIALNTSSESGTCTDLAVPSDYDTDDLRKELRQFGDTPGPITKHTKRLYLKRLIRYKRKPKQIANDAEHTMKCSASIFL